MAAVGDGITDAETIARLAALFAKAMGPPTRRSPADGQPGPEQIATAKASITRHSTETLGHAT